MSSDVYVVFKRGETRWWSWFLHPEINHCEMLIPDRGHWIKYGKAYEEIELFVTDAQSDIIGTIVVKATPIPQKRGLFMLNTCVGQVKQYLGIRKPFVWTPYQLLKYLRGIKNGR